MSTVSDGRQVKVLQMITAYRFLGNRWAQLDPLKRAERPQIAELEPSFYGFTEADFGEVFSTGSFVFPGEKGTLREILEALRQTYCGSIGAEYMYMSDIGHKRWVQARIEPVRSMPKYQARSAEAFPPAFDRGRNAGALPAYQVRGSEALFARGRRKHHRGDG